MHLNILQSLQWVRFDEVQAIDVLIGAGLYLSTRDEITSQVAAGKIEPRFIKLPTGTGPHFKAHLYAFDVRIPGDENDEAFPQHFLESFGTRSELFLETLWLVKDNSANAGALYGVKIGAKIRQCNLPHSAVNSMATCTKAVTVFTLDELNTAIAYFRQLLQLMPKETAAITGPPPMALRHPSRLGRALYLTQAARTTSEVGIKTALYCIAFECLFSTVVDGATKCVADRGSRFVEETDTGRRVARRRFLKLYGYRSRVVHGSAITPKHETKLRASAVAADEDLRKTFRKILANEALTEIFSTDDPARLNTYFDGPGQPAT
jgi:hypothetical protein